MTGSAFGNPKPTGAVDVWTDGKILCHFDLSGGEGHCSLGAHELPGGSYEIEAHYSGDNDLGPSNSGREHLEVTKGSSRAELSLSRSTVVAGKETEEEFRVRVSADDPAIGKATGRVTSRPTGRSCATSTFRTGRATARSVPRSCRVGRTSRGALRRERRTSPRPTRSRKHLEVTQGVFASGADAVQVRRSPTAGKSAEEFHARVSAGRSWDRYATGWVGHRDRRERSCATSSSPTGRATARSVTASCSPGGTRSRRTTGERDLSPSNSGRSTSTLVRS